MTTREPSGPATRPVAGPGFPQSNAFVLQFAADAGPATGLFRGKVQHVTSGEQTSFQSTDELWAFIREVLLGTGVARPVLAASGDEDR